MNKASQVMLVAGVGGLLIWLGARGFPWLKGELAYHRWRQERVHAINLQPSRLHRP